MNRFFNFFKNNKGITLIELIVALALMMLVLPFAWDYMNSGIQDSATINNKVAVQTSVNALMTQLQRDIQEARCPINPNSESYIGIDDDGNFGLDTDGFLICKPNGTGENLYQSTLYEFDEENKKVIVTSGLKIYQINGFGSNEYGIDYSNSNVTTGDYNFIKDITLKRIGDNGIDIYIRGELDSKSGYTLTNTYYTRNTIF